VGAGALSRQGIACFSDLFDPREKYASTGTGVMNRYAYFFAARGEQLFGFFIDSAHNTVPVFIGIMIV